MNNEAFWAWFDEEASPRLAKREVSFRKTFQYLDTLEAPITIVETGCLRTPGNWDGDGQSTLLFDRYVQGRGLGSVVHAVDLNPVATMVCKTLVSDKVTLYTGDSIAVLPRIAKQLKAEGRRLDFLYLDSYDVNWSNPTPSAVHHLKEMVSIVGMVNPQTLIVVDDCATICRTYADANDQLQLLADPVAGGKSTYVAEYAIQVQAKLQFSHYQIGWTNMVSDE